VFHIVREDNRQPAENPAARALKEAIVVGLANTPSSSPGMAGTILST